MNGDASRPVKKRTGLGKPANDHPVHSSIKQWTGCVDRHWQAGTAEWRWAAGRSGKAVAMAIGDHGPQEEPRLGDYGATAFSFLLPISATIVTFNQE